MWGWIRRDMIRLTMALNSFITIKRSAPVVLLLQLDPETTGIWMTAWMWAIKNHFKHRVHDELYFYYYHQMNLCNRHIVRGCVDGIYQITLHTHHQSPVIRLVRTQPLEWCIVLQQWCAPLIQTQNPISYVKSEWFYHSNIKAITVCIAQKFLSLTNQPVTWWLFSIPHLCKKCEKQSFLINNINNIV